MKRFHNVAMARMKLFHLEWKNDQFISIWLQVIAMAVEAVKINNPL